MGVEQPAADLEGEVGGARGRVDLEGEGDRRSEGLTVQRTYVARVEKTETTRTVRILSSGFRICFFKKLLINNC